MSSRWFVLDWWGLALVSLIASLSAFASLIALRIVLLYGWRSGLRGAQWTGSVTWLKIFAFHLLALPIVWTAIDRTARARLAAAFTSAWPRRCGWRLYWRIVLDLIPAALAGGLAAIALLLDRHEHPIDLARRAARSVLPAESAVQESRGAGRAGRARVEARRSA